MAELMNRPKPTAGWWHRAGVLFVALWRRVAAAFEGPAITVSTPRPSTGRLTERRSIPPMAVPARGFAFDFEVHGVFVWTSDGLDRPDLHSLVETFLPYARAHLRGTAAGLARGVEPHRGEDFERRLQGRLSELGDWRYEQRGLRVACHASVWVMPDERIREHIRPYWERLIELDYERDIAVRRARHTDGVSNQWERGPRRPD